MQDMLVALYRLPEATPVVARLAADGILIRRVNPWERTLLVDFARDLFGANWADEVQVAFAHQPITCFVATDRTARRIVGMTAYECTRRGFLGPAGVHPDYRGRDIGRALLLRALEGLRDLGYAYGIIGGVGPAEFYARCAGAVPIADSTPGVYEDLLPRG